MESFDVVVVGAGNAGLCAALSAREAGARVLVLEKAPRAERGGNTAFTGGLLGVGILIGTIIAVPRIGVAATTAAILAAQVTTSAIIDQFGLLGVAARPLTLARLVGLAPATTA